MFSAIAFVQGFPQSLFCFFFTFSKWDTGGGGGGGIECLCACVYMYVPALHVVYPYLGASLVAQLVKNPPAMWETLA